MKKQLVFVTLNFLTSALMAVLIDPDVGESTGLPIREPTQIKELPLDDATLKGVILDFADNIWLDHRSEEDILNGIRGIAKEYDIPPERMTMMLENIVREGLRDMKIQKKDSLEYSDAKAKTVEPVRMLGVFHGPNTIALVKECAQSEDGGRISALKTYIQIVGAVEAMPFILEVFAKELLAKSGNDMNPFRIGVFKDLHRAAQKLKAENKNDDADFVYTALIAFAFLEFEPNTAVQLDQILCSALPDYASSIDREKSIEKFLDKGYNTDYFKNVRNEINKIPAKQRRDYGKQPLVKNPPKEIKTITIQP